jgi:hypothetical protein
VLDAAAILDLPSTAFDKRIGTTRKGLRDSVHTKGCIDGLSQGRPTERLEQALHRTRREQAGAKSLVSVSRDEDDRNLEPAAGQFFLKRRSAHAWHGDVQNQAARLTEQRRRKKLFGRRTRLRSEAECPE